MMSADHDQCCSDLPVLTPKAAARPNDGSSAVAERNAVVPTELSHVGRAIFDALTNDHNPYRGSLWNLTTGSVVGHFHQTPAKAFRSTSEPVVGHDDWFPAAMGEILSRCEYYADILSLRPPDGLFMEEFRSAIKKISAKKRDHTIIVRMMFGNVLAWPVNCEAAIQELTQEIQHATTTNVRLWVAAWRKQFSWNHAKIIAVDGKWLHTGGHNMWSQHYLKVNPLHDLSVELEGRVACDGHYFANQQWSFIEHGEKSILKTFVSLSSFPKNVTSAAASYPPPFRDDLVPGQDRYPYATRQVPILTIGKCGTLVETARPSNDAILTMLTSARKCIRLAIQDLGPRCMPLPCTQLPYPGHPWPAEILSVLAHVLWKKRVHVSIVLSNPGAICGGLPASDTLARPNGWTLQQVVDEIHKAIGEEYPESQSSYGLKKIRECLRVCAYKQRLGNTYGDGTKMGMHTKCFIVDDVACYIGSQNLYVCDLAEWGVVIDDQRTTQKLIEEYWSLIWQCSYFKRG